MTLLIAEVNFIKGNFSGGVNEYIFGCWVGFPHIQVSHECLGEQ